MNLHHLCLYIVSFYLDMNETVYEEYLYCYNDSIFSEDFYDQLCQRLFGNLRTLQM